jgi:MoaA/NifB/PqqE/SkfB family radical SAM enzyme
MIMARRAYITQVFFDFVTNFWGKISDLLSPILFLPPLVLRIRITNRCNLSCHFCYLGGSLNLKNNEVLTLDEWIRIIKAIPRFTLIDITGGEPFLAPHFKDVIELMLKRKLKISLITNGTIPRPEIVEMFVVKKLRYFMVSLDGTSLHHDKIRGIGSFDKTIQTLTQIIDYKKKHNSKYPLIVCKINLANDNHDSLMELSQYLLENLKVDGLTFNLLFNNDARDGIADSEDFFDPKLWSGNTMKYEKESIESIANALTKIRERFTDKISIRPKIGNDDFLGYLRNPSSYAPQSCFKYRSVTTLYFDGRITPCDLGLKVGNIREINYDIRKIKNLSDLKKFFNLFKLNKRNIPGCAGCCLKTQELINEV